MLYPIYNQTLPKQQQPILADNNFNPNFNSVARKSQPPWPEPELKQNTTEHKQEEKK